MSDEAFPAPIQKQFNRPFWNGIEDHQLLIQECFSCGHKPYPPRSLCPACFEELEWTEASGNGTIHSFGIVHRPNQPAVFDSQTPIIIATIKLEEGPLFVSNIINCDAEDVAIGDDVQVTFEEIDDVILPKFELA